jgi:superfamily II DNA or RNA helicase
MSDRLIDLETARQLLDFGARIGAGPRAEEQLQGAVAIRNLLARHGVAYLADEVGMGKTYVALGALALYRHFDPGFRVLVIAPRENIQRKWMKELRNFTEANVRFKDLRLKGVDGQPAKPAVFCDSLIELARECAVDSDRDCFMRLSSFSLGLSDDKNNWEQHRDRLFEAAPRFSKSQLSTKLEKDEFKRHFAIALNHVIPEFDLVIIDEAHNLKHGIAKGSAARNHVLSYVLGRHPDGSNHEEFGGYSPKAKRVLLLSATPLEESYEHVANQLDVVGFSHVFPDLRADDEDARKKAVASFLIRRVTSMTVKDEKLTKNQYRREWRAGGVLTHDEPIEVRDPRQRLIVALVQKKVAELLGSEKFQMHFQIGMLASFESFLETAKVKKETDEQATFDDADQTDDVVLRNGIDVTDVNKLAASYRAAFGRELPHPKMDAIVSALDSSWASGHKSLIFVRRVASVEELKRKLDESYDAWLVNTIRDRLPEKLRRRLDVLVKKYRDDKIVRHPGESDDQDRQPTKTEDPGSEGSDEESVALDDAGDVDTFFSWFFRGEGPKGVLSGANVQRRFIQKGTTFATFFEDNHTASTLGAEPGTVTLALALHLGLTEAELRNALRSHAARYFSATAKKLPRGDRIKAFQAAAFELLMEGDDDVHQQAKIVWQEWFEPFRKSEPRKDVPEPADELEVVTFFTELRRTKRARLRERIWPQQESGDFRARFRNAQLRAQLLATAARLGHSLVDLWLLAVDTVQSLNGHEIIEGTSIIDSYLDLLERQMDAPRGSLPWGAFDELAELSEHFDLILDVNAPECRTSMLTDTARVFGTILSRQRPVAGMSGTINKNAVQQFRMPGYPLVLVTTDVLQEGEDLHTFCTDVYHYGISWTPSSMEQRIGRIDRVRSAAERRLADDKSEEAKLQVYYPYLSDTVEILQVNRVLERMNTFLRLMHEGLETPSRYAKGIDVPRELAAGRKYVEAITEQLKTAFAIAPDLLPETGKSALAVQPNEVAAIIQRFGAIRDGLASRLGVRWEPVDRDSKFFGTVDRDGHEQAVALMLETDPTGPILRCSSPVGMVGSSEVVEAVMRRTADCDARVSVVFGKERTHLDLFVEDDVTLVNLRYDLDRARLLVERVLGTVAVIEERLESGEVHSLQEFADDLAEKESANER